MAWTQSNNVSQCLLRNVTIKQRMRLSCSLDPATSWELTQCQSNRHDCRMICRDRVDGMVLLQFKQSHRAPPADENGNAPKKPSVRDMLEGPPQPKLYEVRFFCPRKHGQH